MRQDLNSQPFDRESSSITTRPEWPLSTHLLQFLTPVWLNFCPKCHFNLQSHIKPELTQHNDALRHRFLTGVHGPLRTLWRGSRESVKIRKVKHCTHLHLKHGNLGIKGSTSGTWWHLLLVVHWFFFTFVRKKVKKHCLKWTPLSMSCNRPYPEQDTLLNQLPVYFISDFYKIW